MSNGENQSEFKDITGLWRSKSGKTYTAQVKEEIVIPAGTRLIVKKNRFKKEDKHPDLILSLVIESDSQIFGDQEPVEDDVPF